MVKRIITAVCVLLLFIVGIFGISKLIIDNNSAPAKVVTTNFVAYDFARAVLGEASEVSLLLPPGSDAHSFEPTPRDIMTVSKAELLIYNGGESESWVLRVIENSGVPRTLRMMDTVEVLEEGEDGVLEGSREVSSEGSEAKTEYDEHIWTSPKNAIKIVESIRDKLVEVFPSRAEELKENARKYIAEISEIDSEIWEIAAGATKKLIFADRFPFLYFVHEYKLDYLAAFPGCSEQTEASSATVAKLIEAARGKKYILKIELTSDALAKTVSSETGAEILTLSSMHNVSSEDFKSGKTYVDYFRENLEVLRKVLE